MTGKFSSVTKYIKNLPGFHTKRKILVFESDDWGSIRMPSRDVFFEMRAKGFDTSIGNAGRYNLYDSLATQEDLSKLFEVLTSVQDSNRNHCVFTAMSVVANPDFKRIAESDFRAYYYEPFTNTLQRYYGCEKSFELWKKGINSGIFVPEFHGREHLNFMRWLTALNHGDPDALLAFRYQFWGHPRRPNSFRPERSFQAAFEIDHPSELSVLDKVITEGLDLFSKLFGYSAFCFTPPNGPLNRINERKSAEGGIKVIQTARVLYNEPIGYGKTRKSFRYLGKMNEYGQVYFIRNCFFEPSDRSRSNWVKTCLREIDEAFNNNKPAIISSHRVNYIGALQPENRDLGLILLQDLLKSLIRQHPEAEFLTSAQLGKIILQNEA